jgi:hypothetical protein
MNKLALGLFNASMTRCVVGALFGLARNFVNRA